MIARVRVGLKAKIDLNKGASPRTGPGKLRIMEFDILVGPLSFAIVPLSYTIVSL